MKENEIDIIKRLESSIIQARAIDRSELLMDAIKEINKLRKKIKNENIQRVGKRKGRKTNKRK